jgi:hypothetical protein
MKPVKNLLGTLIKHHPYYMTALIKPNNYEEIFVMNKQWLGLLQFTKNEGTFKDPYQNYISSLITIQDGVTTYQEHICYFLISSTNAPTVVQPIWKKNKIKIRSDELPPEFFKLLVRKHNSAIMYSSSPR